MQLLVEAAGHAQLLGEVHRRLQIALICQIGSPTGVTFKVVARKGAAVVAVKGNSACSLRIYFRLRQVVCVPQLLTLGLLVLNCFQMGQLSRLELYCSEPSRQVVLVGLVFVNEVWDWGSCCLGGVL